MEKTRLEEDFSNEMTNFSEHWADKISNYQEECKQMEQELLEHNKKSLEEYKQYLEETTPLKPKDSSKLINIKSQIENLARVEEFKEAHQMQQRAFGLENEEQDKWMMERTKKVNNLLDQKVNLHQIEYNSLRKRILTGLDELERQRKDEYERVFLKYNNLKKNIETNQTMQIYMLEKSMKSEKLHNSIKQYYISTEENAQSKI
jgi:hypothetical protein